jgi:hypothetical protein
MSWLGFSNHLLIRPLKILLNVRTLNKPLTPSLLILAVIGWILEFSIIYPKPFINILTEPSPAGISLRSIPAGVHGIIGSFHLFTSLASNSRRRIAWEQRTKSRYRFKCILEVDVRLRI